MVKFGSLKSMAPSMPSFLGRLRGGKGKKVAPFDDEFATIVPACDKMQIFPDADIDGLAFPHADIENLEVLGRRIRRESTSCGVAGGYASEASTAAETAPWSSQQPNLMMLPNCLEDDQEPVRAEDEEPPAAGVQRQNADEHGLPKFADAASARAWAWQVAQELFQLTPAEDDDNSGVFSPGVASGGSGTTSTDSEVTRNGKRVVHSASSGSLTLSEDSLFDSEVAHDGGRMVRSASFDSLAVSVDSNFASEDARFFSEQDAAFASEGSLAASEDSVAVQKESAKKAVAKKPSRKPPRIPGPVVVQFGGDESPFNGRWVRCSPKGTSGDWLDHLTIHGATVVDGVGKTHTLEPAPEGPWLKFGWLRVKGDVLFRFGVTGRVLAYTRAA